MQSVSGGTATNGMVDCGVQTTDDSSPTGLLLARRSYTHGLASSTMRADYGDLATTDDEQDDWSSLAYQEQRLRESASARKRQSFSSAVTVRSQTRSAAQRGKRDKGEQPTAIIELKEEKAKDVHELLCWIYPHLDCVITWSNVEGVSGSEIRRCAYCS